MSRVYSTPLSSPPLPSSNGAARPATTTVPIAPLAPSPRDARRTRSSRSTATPGGGGGGGATTTTSGSRKGRRGKAKTSSSSAAAAMTTEQHPLQQVDDGPIAEFLRVFSAKTTGATSAQSPPLSSEDSSDSSWRMKIEALERLVDGIPDPSSPERRRRRRTEDGEDGDDAELTPRWYESPHAVRKLSKPCCALLMMSDRHPTHNAAAAAAAASKRTAKCLTTLFAVKLQHPPPSNEGAGEDDKGDEDGKHGGDNNEAPQQLPFVGRHLLRDLLPTLLNLHGGKSTSSSTSAAGNNPNPASHLLASIWPTCRSRACLPLLLDRLRRDGNRDVREACARYLRMALEFWPDSSQNSIGSTDADKEENEEEDDEEALENSTAAGDDDAAEKKRKKQSESWPTLPDYTYLTRDVVLDIGRGLARAVLDASGSVRSEARFGLDTLRSSHRDVWDDIVAKEDGAFGTDGALRFALLKAAERADSKQRRMSSSKRKNNKTSSAAAAAATAKARAEGEEKGTVKTTKDDSATAAARRRSGRQQRRVVVGENKGVENASRAIRTPAVVSPCEETTTTKQDEIGAAQKDGGAAPTSASAAVAGGTTVAARAISPDRDIVEPSADADGSPDGSLRRNKDDDDGAELAAKVQATVAFARELSDARDEINRLKMERDDLASALSGRNRDNANERDAWHTERTKLESVKSDLEREVKELQSTVETLATEKDAVASEKDALEVTVLESGLERNALTEECQRAKAEADELASRNTKLEASMETQRERHDKDMSDVKSKLSELEASKSELERLVQSQTATIKEWEATDEEQRETHATEMADLQSQLAEVESSRSEWERKAEVQSVKIQDLDRSMELLRADRVKETADMQSQLAKVRAEAMELVTCNRELEASIEAERRQHADDMSDLQSKLSELVSSRSELERLTQSQKVTIQELEACDEKQRADHAKEKAELQSKLSHVQAARAKEKEDLQARLVELERRTESQRATIERISAKKRASYDMIAELAMTMDGKRRSKTNAPAMSDSDTRNNDPLMKDGATPTLKRSSSFDGTVAAAASAREESRKNCKKKRSKSVDPMISVSEAMLEEMCSSDPIGDMGNGCGDGLKDGKVSPDAADARSGTRTESNEDMISLLIDDARSAFAEKNYSRSATKCTLALKAYPKDCAMNNYKRALILANRSAALLMLGAYEAVCRDCKSVIKLLPTQYTSSGTDADDLCLKPKILNQMADAYLKLGKLDEAEEGFKRALDMAKSSMVLYKEANTSISGEQNEKAVATAMAKASMESMLGTAKVAKCREALGGIPLSGTAGQGGSEEALANVDLALGIAPGCDWLHEKKVSILGSLQQWNELACHSETIAAQTAKLDGIFIEDLANTNPHPNVSPAKHLAGANFDKGRLSINSATLKLSAKAGEVVLRLPDKILQYYLQALRLEERFAEAKLGFAAIKAHFLGSLDEKYPWLANESGKLSKTISGKERGISLQQNGDYEGAAAEYATCLAISGARNSVRVGGRLNAVLFCSRAACLMAVCRYHEAVEECTAALQIHPQYMTAILQRSRCYMHLERAEDAIAEYKWWLHVVEEAKMPSRRDVPQTLYEFNGPASVSPDEVKKVKQELLKAVKLKHESKPQPNNERKDGPRRGAHWNRGGWSKGRSNSQSHMCDDSSVFVPNYYTILQIDINATHAEIKKAYRKMALQHHPDKNSDPLTVEKFHQIKSAYEVLSDDRARREYNAEIRFESK